MKVFPGTSLCHPSALLVLPLGYKQFPPPTTSSQHPQKNFTLLNLDVHLIGLNYSKSGNGMRKREGKVTTQKTEVDMVGKGSEI